MRAEQASGPQKQGPQQPGQRNALFTRKRMHEALPGPQPARCMEPRAPCFGWCANNNHTANQAPLKTLQRICEHHKVRVEQHSAKTLIEPEWAAACFDLFLIENTVRACSCDSHSRANCVRPARPLPSHNGSEGPHQPASQQRPTGNKNTGFLQRTRLVTSDAHLLSQISSWPACRQRRG